MFNVVDLIVVIIIGLMAFIGYKRGFVKTAFGMLSFIVAVILAIVFYKSFAGVLSEKTGIDEWIYETISGKVDEASKSDNSNTESSDETSIKDAFNNLPEKIKNELGLEETKARAKNAIAEKAVSIGMNLISFVLIYVVARIILAIACFVRDLLMQLPALKQANEILGMLLGGVQGLFGIFAALAIIMSLTSIVNLDWLLSAIKNSLITEFLYENNFIMWFLF